MFSTDANKSFLGQNHQFSIPIFQRDYNWNEKECKQLLDDIIAIG